eukprot:5455469-Ditylum_brightwellii.AAC.1
MPLDSHWVLWRRFLKDCFVPHTSQAHRLTKPIRLVQPLGDWLTTSPYTAREYYYSASNNSVYHLQHGSFSIYNAIVGHATWFHISNSTSNDLPSDTEFCRVMKFGSTIHCRAPISQTSVENQQIQTTNTASFSEYIATQPAHVQCLLGNLQTTEVDVDYWISAINARAAMIATNSSAADRNGFFATVLHTEEQTLQFQGPCNGLSILMTSYRAELTGILSTLYLLCALSTFSRTDSTTAPTLFCDNSVAVT